MKYAQVYSSSTDLKYLTQLEKINEKIDKLLKKVRTERFYLKRGYGYGLWKARKNMRETVWERFKIMKELENGSKKETEKYLLVSENGVYGKDSTERFNLITKIKEAV